MSPWEVIDKFSTMLGKPIDVVNKVPSAAEVRNKISIY